MNLNDDSEDEIAEFNELRERRPRREPAKKPKIDLSSDDEDEEIEQAEMILEDHDDSAVQRARRPTRISLNNGQIDRVSLDDLIRTAG